VRTASVILLGVALVTFLLIPSASAATVQYGHTLGGPARETGRVIGVDGAGNVYQFGTTNANGAGAFLAKRDPQGAVLWQRILNFGGTLNPVGLAVAPNGTAYFTGQFGSNFTSGTMVGKILADGTLGFSKFTTAFVGPNGIAFDSKSGGALITGGTNYTSPTGGVFAVDPLGNLRWASFANGTTVPYSAALDGNGTAFVATTRYISGRPDAGIAAFDPSGTLLQERRLDLPNDEIGRSVAFGPDGEVYYLGLSNTNSDAIAARFSKNLVPRWTEYLGSPSLFEYPWRLVSRGDGTFFAQGDFYDLSFGQSGSVLYRVSSSGALVDSGLLPTTGPGGATLRVQDIAAGPDGSILLSGSSYRSPPRDETPVRDARVAPINAPWTSGSSGWHSQSVSLSNLAGTLTDPNFPADDFRIEAQDQAWYGAIAVPASAVTAVAHASVTNRTQRIVAFSANVSGGTPPYSYRWSFGDANSSTQANPTHAYTGGSRYPVQLMVTDSRANRSYSFVDLLLGGPPVITNVFILPNPTYVGQYTYFNATGTDPDGSIVNWHWDFGDGTTWDASYGSTYHVYRALGTYNVSVTARDNDGLETRASRSLKVADQPPYACFYVSPNPTVVGYPTNFQDCSYDPDGSVVSWSWNFGDGTIVTGGANGSARYLFHTYTAPGSYVVQLTVTDNAGITATLNQTVQVRVNQLPIARFRYSPPDPIAGQAVFFNGANSSDPDGSITRWTWDFGDGTNVTNYYYPYVDHYYPRGGRYTVSLTVTDNFNGVNKTSVSLYVDIPPTASFTPARAFGKVGTPLVFDASVSSDADGRIVRYEWTFGDGGNATQGGPLISHVYAATGTYTVTLVVWDDRNATASFQKTISVLVPKAPFAVLSFTPSRPFVGTAVAFDGSRSDDPDGTIARYVWQFGDGAVAEGATLTHRYAYPGTYAVHLTVVDEDGIAVTTSSDITAVSQPIAAFSVSPNPPRVSESATFTANGSWDLTGSLVYHWDFGDGTHGAGWQTTKEYTAPGTYHVTLNVTNPFGVSAIAVRDIVVGLSTQGVTAAGIPGDMITLWAVVGVGAIAVVVGVFVRRRTRPPKL